MGESSLSNQLEIPSFSFHGDIGNYLRTKRLEKYPKIADVSESIGGGRSGSLYTIVTRIEQGKFSERNSEQLDKYLDSIGFSTEEQDMIRGRLQMSQNIILLMKETLLFKKGEDR